MTNASAAQFAVRFIGISAIPPILLIAALVSFWPLIYIGIPLFLPFCAYEYSCSSINVHGAPTMFHESCRTWSAAFVLAAAFVTTWATRKRSFWIALVALIPIAIALALVTHLALYALGFCYWLDSL